MDDLTLNRACFSRADKLVMDWVKANAHSVSATMYSLDLLKQKVAEEFRRSMQPLVGIYDVAALALQERKSE
jgi:hypothetical protein